MKISAKVVQHSTSYYTNKEIITYELEYPRYIHAEFMTHRVFSRNAASSRAIPIAAMHEQIIRDDVTFTHFGKNQRGMQAKEELSAKDKNAVEMLWFDARDACIAIAQLMERIGLHKQCVNRLTEPWAMMKVVMTTTQEANWQWLRNHEDAQPEIRVLAEKMLEARNNSTPLKLKYGEWHLPYVSRTFENGVLKYGEGLSLEDARIISASCCAQVSYRKNDDSLEKARSIFDRMINTEPVHASPVEHQATPIDTSLIVEGISLADLRAKGITHRNTDGSLGSGNFTDWIQFRQLIPNNVKNETNL